MAVVTVAGASGAHIPVTVDGAAALSLAKAYAATISHDAKAGSLFAQNLRQGVVAPKVPDGKIGEAVILKTGFYAFPKGYDFLTDGAIRPVTIDETRIHSSTSVLAGTGGTTLLGGAGGGEFIAGGGNNLFVGDKKGDYTIATGSGNDTIDALKGNDTITDGVGRNKIFLGSGNSVVRSYGADSITAGSGMDTVHLQGEYDTVRGGSGNLFVDNDGQDNLIVGGSGADTIFAGSGNNTLTGGFGKGNDFNLENTKLGGHVTITDFKSAAGNIVGLYGFGANEIEKALATAKNVHGGSMLTLSDKVTVTFTNVSADFLKDHPNKFFIGS